MKSLVRVLSNVDVRGATAWVVLRGQAIENLVGIEAVNTGLAEVM